MKFTISKEAILLPLQVITGVVERRSSMPILSNVLLDVRSHQLSMTGTDLELNIVGLVTLVNPAEGGTTTVPARKLLDICKNLASASQIEFTLEKEQLVVRSGKSRFLLSTLAANDFPTLEDSQGLAEFSIPQTQLVKLLAKTYFSMAQQDVRYYLNGVLLEIEEGKLRTVATDGHRIAVCSLDSIVNVNNKIQVILPRKTVLELLKWFDNDGSEISVTIGGNYIRFSSGSYCFTSKLIDAKFPDYNRVIPSGGDKILNIDRDVLKQMLTRVSVLSNEKSKGVHLKLRPGMLTLTANNAEQEEALEEVEISYNGGEIDTGFNVSYFLDILNNIPNGDVRLTLSHSNTGIYVESLEDEDCAFVVMPMRL